MHPKVNIDVDEQTGTWMTDGLPMLYVPRHFMVNVHDAVEKELGREAYRRVLGHAGSKSAYHWCKQQSETGAYRGMQVFEHYLERLTSRGWGQFSIEALDMAAGSATVTLKNSIYVLQGASRPEHPVCYMFEGFLEGAFRYITDQQGTSRASIACREVQCEAMGFDHCEFALAI